MGMVCGRLARPFFWRNDKPRGGGLRKSSGCRLSPARRHGRGRHRAVPAFRAAHKATPARRPRERKQLHAPGLPAPTNDHGIRIHTDHPPEDGAESAAPKTALSIVQCVTAEAAANAPPRAGAPGWTSIWRGSRISHGDAGCAPNKSWLPNFQPVPHCDPQAS